MGDRTPYTQRVDEDLQDFVDTVSHRTNLSKADVMDEALRRLMNNSTITDDGQFLVDGDYGESGLEDDENSVEQLLENQQQMMQMLSSSTPSPSPSAESQDPDKNTEEVNVGGANGGEDGTTVPNVTDEGSASEVEERLAALAGEYDHDECLDPEEIGDLDTHESDVVSHTARYLVTAVVGMINHGIEHGGLSEPVRWSRIKAMMETRLDVSRGSLYNYRNKMVAKGALIPHPSIDEEVTGDEMVATAREQAAAVASRRHFSEINADNLSDKEAERYVDDAEEYLGEFVSDWKNVYYVSEETYQEDVWGMVQEAIRYIALTSPDTSNRPRPNGDGREMYDAERAAGADAMLAQVIDLFGVHQGELHRVRSMAQSVSGKDDLEEWATCWAEVQAGVEAELFADDEADVDGAKETFREEIGVNPDDVDEDELLTEYKTWVKQNHPDTGGDVEPEVFGDVMQARNVLLD